MLRLACVLSVQRQRLLMQVVAAVSRLVWQQVSLAVQAQLTLDLQAALSKTRPLKAHEGCKLQTSRRRWDFFSHDKADLQKHPRR